VQLDNNRIAIRERSLVDVMDLAIRVTRAHLGPLTVAFILGVVPFAVLNAWLLADRLTYTVEFFPASELAFELPNWYLWYMTWLIILEIPLATAPMTIYLGQSLFEDRPDVREIVRGYWRTLPQMVWYQVILRALCLPMVITWALLFAGWPYLSEVILLERNPWTTRQKNRMTTYRRAKALHGRNGGELFARWLGALIIGIMLFIATLASIFILGGLLWNDWSLAMPVFTVFIPMTVWLLVGFFAVVRFLAYLDLRIRCEGWEVELMMRAEGNRLTRRLT